MGKPLCVTGATGYIGSWLVKCLLDQGHTVHATLRHPGDAAKTFHLLSLPGAKERLRLFKADLSEDGSFDAAINGCEGVFHLAMPLLFHSQNPQMYVVAKTVAEKAALRFTKEHGIDMVTIIPVTVAGHFLTSTIPTSVQVLMSLITGDVEFYGVAKAVETRLGCLPVVHIEDICNAHIFLMFHHLEQVAGERYICSAHSCTISNLKCFLSQQYPYLEEKNTNNPKEQGVESVGQVSSKKLNDLGFQYKHGIEEICNNIIQVWKDRTEHHP